MGAPSQPPEALREAAERALAIYADAERAETMQAYMKTSMPFVGVPKPLRVPIERDLGKRFAPASSAQYSELVLELWSSPSREAKYWRSPWRAAGRSTSCLSNSRHIFN